MKKSDSLKQEKGITLIALAITVIVLIIIASMSIYSANEAMNSSKMTAFTTELKIMQSQVELLNEKMRNNKEVTINDTKYQGSGDKENNILGIQEIGKPITDTQISEQAYKALNSSGVTQDEDKEKYRYYDANLIKEGLGVEGVEQELLINVENREIVSYKGLTIEGITYYTLNQLSDGVYNVNRVENNNKPSFDIDEEISESGQTTRIEIVNISYDGYIDKWKVKYKSDSQNYWDTSDSLTITLDKAGTYKIKIFNGKVESDEKEIVVNTDYEYEKEGLIVHYDAINNTGIGHNGEYKSIKDLSKNNNNGVLNGVTFFEDYMFFDGTSDWIKINNIDNSEKITLEATIKINELQSGERYLIGNLQQSGIGLVINDGNPELVAYISGLGEQRVRATDKLNTEQIYHIAGTYDGNSLKLYVNGKEVGNVNEIEGTIQAPSNKSIIIGAKAVGENGGEVYTNFNLYSCRIYSNSLRRKQIQINYFLDKERFVEGTNEDEYYNQENVLAYFDGYNNTENGHNDKIMSWKDLSGNNNDIIFNNIDMTNTSGWAEDSIILDGKDDYLTINNLDISQYNDLTICATYKTLSINSIAALLCSASPNAGRLYFGYNTSQYLTNFTTPDTWISSSAGEMEIGENAHIIATYKGNNEKSSNTIFKNGSQIMENTTSLQSGWGKYPIEIGRSWGGSDSSYSLANVQLYDLMIYKGTLNSDQIMEHYEKAKLRYGI